MANGNRIVCALQTKKKKLQEHLNLLRNEVMTQGCMIHVGTEPDLLLNTSDKSTNTVVISSTKVNKACGLEVKYSYVDNNGTRILPQVQSKRGTAEAGQKKEEIMEEGRVPQKTQITQEKRETEVKEQYGKGKKNKGENKVKLNDKTVKSPM